MQTTEIPAPAFHELIKLAERAPSGDEAHDVLVAALVRPPGVRVSWGAWFHGALVRRALQVGRSESHRRARERVAARPDRALDVSSQVERAEARSVLMGGLAELQPEARELMRLHYWEGLTLTMIASRRGCDLGVVKRQHACALATLRASIGDPELERRDWAALPWLLAGGLGLAASLVLMVRPAPAPVAPGAPVQVAMMTLAPASPVLEGLPALPLIPIERALEVFPTDTYSVPMTPLTPASQVEPVLPAMDWDAATSLAAL